MLLTQGLLALTVPDEQAEIRAALKAPRIRLRRSFNQSWPDGSVTRYWRVLATGHPNNESDLSLEGLKQWGIL